MPRELEQFNIKLVLARIISEHKIGILKGILISLKDINTRVMEEKKSMLRILKCIYYCILLHNFLVGTDVTEQETKWIEEDYVSVIDEKTRAPRAIHLLNRSLRK